MSFSDKFAAKTSFVVSSIGLCQCKNIEGDVGMGDSGGRLHSASLHIESGEMNKSVRIAGKIQLHDGCILLLDARTVPPGTPASRVSYSVVWHPHVHL